MFIKSICFCLEPRKLMRTSCFLGMKPHVMQNYSSSIGVYLVIIRHRLLHLTYAILNTGSNNTACDVYIIYCSINLSNLNSLDDSKHPLVCEVISPLILTTNILYLPWCYDTLIKIMNGWQKTWFSIKISFYSWKWQRYI